MTEQKTKGQIADEQVLDYVEIIEVLRMRAQVYGMLARLYLKEVDLGIIREMQKMRFPISTSNTLVNEGYRALYDYLKGAWEDSETELAIDYVRTFIGHGVNGYSAAYPFESVYTSARRLMMQEARAEVLKVFRENHLKRGKWTEGEDHIALELEFMQRKSLAAANALEAGDEDACIHELEVSRDFQHDHLLNWLPMIVNDMQKFAKTSFYQGLGKLTLGYVESDAALLNELLGQ